MRLGPSVASTLVIVALTGIQVGCVGKYEPAVRHDLSSVSRDFAFLPKGVPSDEDPSGETLGSTLEAGLAGYLRLALERNPEIRAGFERWKASVHRISRSRRLPEPTIGFGYFVESVETRVGPQQARISLQQAFPWPTKLTAGADAASAQARAMQRRFEAQALLVAQRVATAYWNLWQVRAAKAIRREHLEVIRGLSASVRARISTGAASLADLQQIDLVAAGLEDNIHGMEEAERGAEAQLRAAIGVVSAFPVPTPQEPGRADMPMASPAALASLARAHPMVESLGFLAEASEATARAEGADRFPSFTLGTDWIITDEADTPGVKDSGQDAVIVGVGIRIPLWQGSYADSVAAAEADSRAQLAEQSALLDRVEAELATTLANLRDATRRVAIYRGTLVPQAQAAYASVLGAYTVGRATVAQVLLAQRDLLEQRIELERARADHARTWARLEELVGRELGREPEASPGGIDDPHG
jgi:outer membrane protein TolC